MKNLQKSQNRLDLLARSTDAEKVCYNILTSLGYKVIKQQPVFTGAKVYYLDLYIPKLRLAIECDGGYHYTPNQKRKDNNRSAGLRRLGIHVYRLSNHDARNVSKVEAKIRRLIRSQNFASNKL